MGLGERPRRRGEAERSTKCLSSSGAEGLCTMVKMPAVSAAPAVAKLMMAPRVRSLRALCREAISRAASFLTCALVAAPKAVSASLSASCSLPASP